MWIRQLAIERFRGIEHLQFEPGSRNVIIGPNNAGKSTILEALDLLLHSGLGRPRRVPSEVDYFGRDPSKGFVIEAVMGALSGPFRADVHQHFEGWQPDKAEVVATPDGDGIETIVRVRVRGTEEFDLVHEFSKPESEGVRFSPALRAQVGWVFDGRTRDPVRQLAFYQGGLLERLFADVDLDPSVNELRAALGLGADALNQDSAVALVLENLSNDLRHLGLLSDTKSTQFEIGSVSKRELLQSLRLALQTGDFQVPLSRQGRGAQRLALVAVLLRLAEAAGHLPIGGFEEPEEALEPLRQAQLASMLIGVAEKGGQIFIVTHSPEIARAFQADDFLLLPEPSTAATARPLRKVLSAPVRQTYERWVDGAVVRGLFAHIPILVEGPGDRSIFEVFWRALAKNGNLIPAAQLGIDLVNCEGAPNIPMLAAVLHEAGKSVVVWAEQDTEEVHKVLERLREEGHCAALLLHSPAPGRQNLEQALSFGSSLDALAKAMTAIAEDRGYSWEEQRSDLVSRCEGVEVGAREMAKASNCLSDFLSLLEEGAARQLVASTLSARGVAPFEMKGGRQSRILAEKIVEIHGVPHNFSKAFRSLQGWIAGGCPRGAEIVMAGD